MHVLRILATGLFLLAGTSWLVGAGESSAGDSPTPAPAMESVPATPTASTPTLHQEDLRLFSANVQRPNALQRFEDTLFVSCHGDYTVYQIDAHNGETRPWIYGVQNAHTLHVERDTGGTLVVWAPDFQTDSLLRVTRAGIRTVRAELGGPWGIAAVGEDGFLISSLRQNRIYFVWRAGAARVAIESLRAPTGIAHDGEYVYVANNGSARRAVEWVPLDEALSNRGLTAEPRPLVSGLQNVTGLALGHDGLLYIAHSLGTRGVVSRIDPAHCRAAGGCDRDATTLLVFSQLEAPLAGLALSADGRLYLHSMFSPNLYQVDLGTLAQGQLTRES